MLKIISRASRAVVGDERWPEVRSRTERIARKLLPPPAYDYMLRQRGKVSPPVGTVDFGDFRRLEPMSREFGFDRGHPIDRYYIENFLEAEGDAITGRVLEIGDNTYTHQFGHEITQPESLHVQPLPGVTFVDDLARGTTLPSGAFDCIILTQTLHLIYDMRAAMQTVYRILKPGGTVLVTVPGISQMADEDWNSTWHWSLTPNSCDELFSEFFPSTQYEIKSYGNVLSAISFLQGMVTNELTKEELDHHDPSYPVTITIRASTAHRDTKVSLPAGWSRWTREPHEQDPQTSLTQALAFLDGQGAIEDWGAGSADARRLVQSSAYVAVDALDSEQIDVKADLQDYRSNASCILIRHVLEHNWGWRRIVANAVASFENRMAIVIYTPFSSREAKLDEYDEIPILALDKAELTAFFTGLDVREETISSKTDYGQETIFYLSKK
jgi:SAM-dependent methyltransferase